MLKVSYHARAREEVAQAGRVYSSISPELGGSFFTIFDQAIADIQQFPHDFPKVEGDFRLSVHCHKPPLLFDPSK